MALEHLEDIKKFLEALKDSDRPEYKDLHIHHNNYFAEEARPTSLNDTNMVTTIRLFHAVVNLEARIRKLERR